MPRNGFPEAMLFCTASMRPYSSRFRMHPERLQRRAAPPCRRRGSSSGRALPLPRAHALEAFLHAPQVSHAVIDDSDHSMITRSQEPGLRSKKKTSEMRLLALLFLLGSGSSLPSPDVRSDLSFGRKYSLDAGVDRVAWSRARPKALKTPSSMWWTSRP